MPQYKVEALLTIRSLQSAYATAGRAAQAEQLRALGDQVEAMSRCISEIRTVTALPDVPLVELPGMIETLLSELADRQIRADIEPYEFLGWGWSGCGGAS